MATFVETVTRRVLPTPIAHPSVLIVMIATNDRARIAPPVRRDPPRDRVRVMRDHRRSDAVTVATFVETVTRRVLPTPIAALAQVGAMRDQPRVATPVRLGS